MSIQFSPTEIYIFGTYDSEGLVGVDFFELKNDTLEQFLPELDIFEGIGPDDELGHLERIASTLISRGIHSAKTTYIPTDSTFYGLNRTCKGSYRGNKVEFDSEILDDKTITNLLKRGLMVQKHNAQSIN